MHLIFVCKYRKKLLLKLGDAIKALMHSIAEESNFGILETEVDKDHIHLLVEHSPSQSVLEIVRSLKQISTYRIWRDGYDSTYLEKHFWKENTFWSDGYFACSIGQISKSVIEQYIRAQG